MADCDHDFQWFADFAQERGWKCLNCKLRPGEPEGFSPQHDREFIDRKVFALLNDLFNADLIYVSNGTEGDYLVAHVAERCREAGCYDQGTVLLFLVEAKAESHAKFWAEISNGIIAGKDPRERCECGKLATSSTLDGKGGWIRECNECWPKRDR